jgi:hypothetical protein
VHVDASVLLQVSVDVPPLTILAGVAVSITVGTGAAGVTTTVVLASAEPPAQEQIKVKPVVDVIAPVETPTALLVDCGPLQPPEAVHVVASVLLHVSVDVPPLTILAGVAVSITVGAGAAGVTTTVVLEAPEPPGPEQLKVNPLVDVSTPVEIPTALLVDCGPLQPPEAVHNVASVLLQVSVDVSPLTILAGVAVSITVGADAAGVTTTVVLASAEPPAPEQLRV